MSVEERATNLVKKDELEFLLDIICHSAALIVLGTEYGIEQVEALRNFQTPIVHFHGMDRMQMTVDVGADLRRIYVLSRRTSQDSLVLATLANYLNLAVGAPVHFQGIRGKQWTLFKNVE